METRMNNAELNISRVQDRVESIVHHSTLVDSAEMIFTGIPKELSLDQNTVVTKLLDALEHPELIGFVLDVREWKGPPLGNPTSQTNEQPTTAIAQSSSPHTSLVLKLASVAVRDSLVFNSAKLKNKTARDIFGINSQHEVFCRPLWPKEVHQLLRKAWTACAQLNYDRPVVRNLVVCVRQTRSSPLIPIFTEKELQSLTPRPIVN
ncbi:hypothetical protein QAD02_005030 [Eretmocerus hayati]|uniref:Uncharacterized protein n=1 Tax=Eretmocerus hayati TaxID=131215 RepID=A0ACC2NSC9_9HYME|nr:hypothetical protein QAD02_005030 [Eretmocerus hayati]